MSEPLSARTAAQSSMDAAFAAKGIWIFVAIDMAIFALFFFVFLAEKRADPGLFALSQTRLNAHFGFSNTLLLMTSSWLLVESLHRFPGSIAAARRLLLLSMALGGVFVVSKLVEYYLKFSAGISIVENTFFSFYFLLTFIHFCHVLAGLIVLASVYRGMARHKNYDVKPFAESVGIYWHMVDLLWVFLFLLLYLM